MTARELTINELIEESSLGSEAAKSLRSRTVDEQVDRVRRTAELAAADDHELLRQYVAGDPDAFAILIKRHGDRLMAVALRSLGEVEEAAEALREALGSAAREADSFRGDTRVITWLHRFVVNACLDRIRRRQPRSPERPPAGFDRLLGSTNLETGEVDVLDALAKINADQRDALVLVDIEGYSFDEAAALLGCAPATVKSRCARGRARLVTVLRRQGSENSD